MFCHGGWERVGISELQEALPNSVYGLPLTGDYQLGSDWLPDLLEEANSDSPFEGSYGFISPQVYGQDGSFGSEFHGLEPKGLRDNPSAWLQSANDLKEPSDEDFDRDQGMQTFYDDELYPPQEFDPGLPISLNEANSLEGRNDILQTGNYYNEGQGPTLGSFTNVHQPTQLWPTISLPEHLLAERSNKITISTDLLTIYYESLENALQCWIDRGSCPYRLETEVGAGPYDASERARRPSTSTTLYDRVHKLDAAFSGQRPTTLTRAEDSGSSKVLKLAVMAFASQWSHESQSSRTNHNETVWASTGEYPDVETRSNSDLEASGAQDFGCLLRLSVWHESQRCLARWRHCGSFRVILASIVLFCTQPPLDEDERTDLPEGRLDSFAALGLRDGEAIAPRIGNADDQLASSASSNNTPIQNSTGMALPDLSLYPSSFYGHEGLHHLEIALGQLLIWRRSIKASSLQGGLRHLSPGSKHLIDFNLLFWLGVMCDTTSSVINRRPLIMPDTATCMDFSSPTRSDLDSFTPIAPGVSYWRADKDQYRCRPERVTRSVDIWGPFLLDADRAWRGNPAKAAEPTSSQLKIRMLQQAVPLKLLFWRKVSRLQTMISSNEKQPTSLPNASEIETAIKEVLAVHEYWSANYGEFFTACLSNHLDLSFQLQSWYLVLVLGWNLACQILAQCIDFVDSNAMSERLGQSLRTSSALTCELRKASAYAIAEAAKVSCYPPTSLAEENTPLTVGMRSTRSSHPVLLGQSALLADPHTEKVIKALEMAADILLDWLRQWRGPIASDNASHLSWLYNNTSSDEISRHCVSCINALDLMKCKSDVSRLTTKHLMVRYRLVTAAMG